MNILGEIGQGIRDYARAHVPSLVIAVIVLVILSVFSFPVYYASFPWHSQLQVGALYATGFLFLALGPLLNAFAASTVIRVVLIVWVSLSVGLLVERVWEAGRLGRVLLLLIVVANFVVGVFLAQNGGYIIVYDDQVTCTAAITEENRVRFDLYPITGFDARRHLFFLASQDGGTWTQFDYTVNSQPQRSECDNVDSLDGDNFWVWSGTTVYRTRDGGESWRQWSTVALTDPELQGCEIDLVRFDTVEEGVMQLLCQPGADTGAIETPYVLITQDGGTTWALLGTLRPGERL